jgi:hypothetical protein
MKALIDSGATISAISESTFARLGSETVKEEIQFPGLEISSASNQKMDVRGVFKISFQEESLGQVEWPLVVVRSMASEVILGMDFLAAFGAVIEAKEKSVRFQETPRRGKVRAAHTVKIAPYSRKVMKGRASTASRGAYVVTLPRKEGVLAGIQEWRGSAGFNVLVVNGSPEWMSIERDEELAEYWQVDDEEICTMEDLRNCRPAARKNSPISEEKKKLIRENVKEEIGTDFRKRLVSVLMDYHEAVSENSADLGRTNVIPHKLVVKSEKQIYKKQFPVPVGHQEFIYKTVEDLLKIGAIKEDLASPHNTPIFAVKKPHSTDLRLVQDLRAVNENIENFQHPILDIPGCLAKLGGMEAKYFAALDLTSGFYQLELDAASQPLTAFTVPGKGRFSWTVSTMGLKTSPGAFSRLMEHVMRPVERAVTYMDDVILAGKSPEDLLESIKQALAQLQKYNLKLNIRKCKFGVSEVDYLGYRISREGAKPGKEKTEAVINFPTPTTQQEVRRFLGMANYFRSHIEHFAQRSKPLTQLTRKDTRWTEGEPLPVAARMAFNDLRRALAQEPITALPQPNQPFILETDGSSEGLGACLTQRLGGKPRVIGYASRALQDHEKNYPAFLLEQAAAVFGIESFSAYLQGGSFELIIDHKPLLALSAVHKKTLARLQQLMSEYNFHLRYRAGDENVVADALSRAPVEALADSYDELRRLQEEDDFCAAALQLCKQGKMPENLEPAAARLLKKIIMNCFIKDGCIYIKKEAPPQPERALLLTPRKCQFELLRAAHAGRFSGHGGEAKTLLRLQQSYFWPGMAGDVAEFVRKCEICQRAKDPPAWKRMKAPLQPLPVPDMPNERIHLDLFSVPKRSQNGNSQVLVITDAFSKWVELVPIPDKSAETVAEAVFNRWICRYACPNEVVTDRGREFCNRLADEMWQKLEVEHKRTAAYHPQTNTSAESFNRTMIKILRATLDDPDDDWEPWLPVVMLTYNTRVHSATRASPFFLTFLRDPNLPYFDMEEERQLYQGTWAESAMERLQKVNRLAKDNMEKAQQVGKGFYDANAGKLRQFNVGEKVMVRFDPMSFPAIRNKKFFKPWLPHRIVRIVTPTTYVVTAEEPGRGHKKQSTVHVNRIKRWSQPEDDEEEDAAAEEEREQDTQEEEDAREMPEAEEAAADGEEEGTRVEPQPPAIEEETPEEARPLTRARARERGVIVDDRLPPPPVPIEYRVRQARE